MARDLWVFRLRNSQQHLHPGENQKKKKKSKIPTVQDPNQYRYDSNTMHKTAKPNNTRQLNGNHHTATQCTAQPLIRQRNFFDLV